MVIYIYSMPSNTIKTKNHNNNNLDCTYSPCPTNLSTKKFIPIEFSLSPTLKYFWNFLGHIPDMLIDKSSQ